MHSIRTRALTEPLFVSVLPKEVGTTNANSFSFFLFTTDTSLFDTKVYETHSKGIQDEYMLNSSLAFEYYHSPSSFLKEGE